MNAPPAFFEAVRSRSAELWDQLDRNKELAAPWHQLFKQIQSPRHVVSELLQNADDADATSATIHLSDADFVFRHNGQDFEEPHFASLCRFGYSNKRSLHTIGFRGIGFKSTFSLGDQVRVLTPTLQVAFNRARFTEPVWLDDMANHNGLTSFSVAIRDEYRHVEISKNLASWLESPTSLLFFRSLRSLQIGDEQVSWQSGGAGPVGNSEWLSLSGSQEPPVLLIRSKTEEFPVEAIAEIRQERMIEDSESSDLPPCAIELVLGLEGRLFVVLPTGVRTSFPFACNGPFIQDPARLKIKDPEISPTNRWLLERVGRLAADSMLQWLRRGDLTVHERANAYALLIHAGHFDDSLEGSCESIISEAFHDAIEDEPFLITESGDLVRSGECLAVPSWLPDIWSSEQIAAIFDDRHRPILANAVPHDARTALASCGYLPELALGGILQILRDQHLPRPDAWINLLNLWHAVADEVTARRQPWQPSWKNIRILPVQGQDCLYAASEVVRLGEKRLLRSDDDWEFLARHLLVVNPNWTRFVAEQRRAAEAAQDSDLAEKAHNVDRMLDALGMADSSDMGKVMERVANAFFSESDASDADCIRLSQIAAALDAPVPPQFEFISRHGDRISRKKGGPVIADPDSDLDTFLSEEWCQRHALHSSYGSAFQSCSAAEWKQWVEGSRSGLLRFVPLIQFNRQIHRQSVLKQFLAERGSDIEPYFPYVTHNFVIEDWDFAPEHWQHWKSLAAEDENFWGRLVSRILRQTTTYWQHALVAKAFQIATTGSRQQVGPTVLPPAWVMALRGLPCLQDTWGTFRDPADLLRRTPETEALLDIEPFVRAEVDNETSRPLLVSLGVRDTPTGSERLLERLKALATVGNPPFYEVQKWCHRIDSVAPKCSTEELEKLKDEFHSQRLIFTTENTWATASEVFLNPGDEAPGAHIIHEQLKNLTLWQRIGVEERPTVDLAIAWLHSLPRSSRLPADDAKRVRDLLSRYPIRIWEECGCWLNLEGEWTPVETLHYQVSMQALVATRHLFPPVRQQIADLQRLPYELVNQPPFCHLLSLACAIVEQVEVNLITASDPQHVPWLTALGKGLARITYDDANKTARIQELGRRLAKTHRVTVSPLETTPYINGTPAGTGRPTEAVWDRELLYVADQPIVKLFRPIAQELARPFEDGELGDAIKTCAERPVEFINDYLEQNFTLQPVAEVDWTPTPNAVANHPVEIAASAELGVADAVSEEEDADEAVEATTEDDDYADGPAIDDVPGVDAADDHKPVRSPAARPAQPPLIERYARSVGFQKDGSQGRYYHADGRWIQRANGLAFPWELYSSNGELLRCYWTREHCLELEALQLPAEIWELCQNNPDEYSLLTTMPEGKPLELSGRNLQEMKDQGQIKLFPATYRIVYQHDQ